jgi:hypothetical protein
MDNYINYINKYFTFQRFRGKYRRCGSKKKDILKCFYFGTPNEILSFWKCLGILHSFMVYAST